MESQVLPTLRPLRLGELLDQAIRLYRRNFLTFIGIIAVVYVPLMILQTAASTLMTSSISDLAGSTSPTEIFSNYAYWGGLLSTLVVGFLQFIFVQGIATGALTRAVADNYLGKPTSSAGRAPFCGPAGDCRIPVVDHCPVPWLVHRSGHAGVPDCGGQSAGGAGGGAGGPERNLLGPTCVEFGTPPFLARAGIYHRPLSVQPADRCRSKRDRKRSANYSIAIIW